MFAVAATRFNTKTWEENRRWREHHERKGCVYGSPVRITDQIIPELPIFVLEMHNDENAIKGIGLIRNRVVCTGTRIYSDGNYNRYTYEGEVRIDQSEFDDQEKKIVVILEELLFYGKKHLKRGHGIQLLPVELTERHRLLYALGEALIRRTDLDIVKTRLGKLTRTWIAANRDLRLIGWLRARFRAHFRDS